MICAVGPWPSQVLLSLLWWWGFLLSPNVLGSSISNLKKKHTKFVLSCLFCFFLMWDKKTLRAGIEKICCFFLARIKFWNHIFTKFFPLENVFVLEKILADIKVSTFLFSLTVFGSSCSISRKSRSLNAAFLCLCLSLPSLVWSFALRIQFLWCCYIVCEHFYYCEDIICSSW